jgi:hypothetical protein
VKRVSSTIIVVLCALLLAACGTLPDGKPFADATGTWSGAVRSSGQAISDSFRDAASVEPKEKPTYDKLIKDFDDAWSARTKAAQGAVAYSNAISDLLAAGKEGAETANKVGDALQGLAAAAGIPVAAPAFGVATEIAAFLWERIATVRASRQLEASVAEAQPAVDRIAEHMVDEANGQLKPLLENAYKNAVSSIRGKYSADGDFAVDFARKQSELRSAALNDPKKVSELQEFEKVHVTLLARLKERDQKVEEAASVYRTRLQLINALSTSTAAWAQAHRDLAVAIKEKRKVNAAELQETVAELKDLIKKVRAL